MELIKTYYPDNSTEDSTHKPLPSRVETELNNKRLVVEATASGYLKRLRSSYQELLTALYGDEVTIKPKDYALSKGCTRQWVSLQKINAISRLQILIETDKKNEQLRQEEEQKTNKKRARIEENSGDITAIGLSSRALKPLKNAGITTVEQLDEMDDDHLKHIQGLGKTGIAELKAKQAVFKALPEVVQEEILRKIREQIAQDPLERFRRLDVINPVNIRSLYLSNRVRNALLRAGINDTSEISKMEIEELLEVRQLGKDGLEEIRAAIGKVYFC